MEEPLASRPAVVAEEGVQVRRVPLQLGAQDEGGRSLAVDCASLSGASLKRLTLDLEDTGRELALRLHEEVPALPGTRWQLLLPSGEVLDEREVQPLCQLFFAREPPTLLGATVKSILLLLGPLLLGGVLRNIQALETSIMMGRKGTELLAAVAMSNQWTSLTDAILNEGQGQLSGLCGPAFFAGNYPLVATWLQIYLVYITAATVPVCCLRFLCAPILKWAGVPEDMAEDAGTFAIWTIGALFLDLWAGAVREYYCSQKIVVPDAIVDSIFVFLIVLTLWFFIVFLDGGIMGAAVATTVSRAIRLVLYVGINWCFGNHRKTWHSWSAKEIFQWSRWKQILGLTIPAGLAGIAEQMQMTICVSFVARLGRAPTAAFSLALNIIGLYFTISNSSGEATGIVMNAAMGANQPRRARYIAWTGVAGVFAFNMTLSALLLGVGWKYFVLFATPDPEVQQALDELQYLVMVVVMVLSNAMLLFQIMSKQARAGAATATIVSCCWGIGLPITCVYRGTLVGIISGLVIGYIFGSLLLLLLFSCTDWAKVVRMAREKRAEVPSATRAAGRIVHPQEKPGPEAAAGAGGAAGANPYHTMADAS